MKLSFYFGVILGSLLIGCTPSSELSSYPVSSLVSEVPSDWQSLLQAETSDYQTQWLTIPSDMASKGVQKILAIYLMEEENPIGFGFEARVYGNGGYFTFRLGIISHVFTGFQTINESEHPNFGDRVFQALRNGLNGKSATMESLFQTYTENSLNIQTASVTETLQNLMPPIEAMIGYHNEWILNV